MTRLDLVTVGESLGLLTTERSARFQHGPDMRLGFGGAESNVAIGVTRLGHSAAWIGRVGDDGIGELIIRELRAEQVAVHATIDTSAATALMLKERPSTGMSRITYYRSVQAGSKLGVSDIPDGLIEQARVLHITGITAALGTGPLSALRTAMTRARSAGTVVSFDVNHRTSLWDRADDAAATYRELIANTDIVFAGMDEAELVTGEHGDQRALARALQALGPATAVLKLGDAGAYAIDGETELQLPGNTVDVVDTVGAGDAFVAGWLSETLRGGDLDTRLRTANLCGAIACTTAGDWEAAPRRSDLARTSGEPVRR